ncbi:AAA domain-containing protein [Hungatella effluvii]|uniref:AAA domain-containing protein n=1 Tax=Hungatella effluvii TaxID=1096246 RepID=A0A2V3Y953_9FIRM|nr:helicase RepA family protein [Hungatella effluvii]PXX55275.1 AAA domain-containing protein [Hungatella effluvii]
MTVIKKAAVPDLSIGVDVEQPLPYKDNEIITDSKEQFNQQAINNLTVNMTTAGENDLRTISMTELYDTAYPPRVPIVEGLIFNGTYLFVGAPKVGKSFFMAQLGYHVSMGIPLWGFSVTKGTVLYLALEDDYARLQRRLSKMFGMEGSSNLHFATQSKALNKGLEEQLHKFVKEHEDARLIIIDTLQKVREASGDKLSYGNDYEIVTKLKRFSDQYGICLLVVHHTRKMESSDSFDMISGTNGLLGAADGAFIMQKEKRTENKAVLEVAGRDQQDQRLFLNFNREQCVWELTKSETELWKEPVDSVLESLATVVTNEAPEWSGSASELLQLLPEIDMQPNAFTRKLNVSLERLLIDYNIKYESVREHSGRKIKLSLIQTKA